MRNRSTLGLKFLSLLCVFGLATSSRPQIEKKIQDKASSGRADPARELDAQVEQQRVFAISLVVSLAEEARNYQDQALRPKVLAQAADVLWNTDNDTGRTLFRRAWDAAEKGDAQDLIFKNERPIPVSVASMVNALRRSSGRDLRSEVLNLVARRDSALCEEFLHKLKEDTRGESGEINNGSGAAPTRDNGPASAATAKRFLLARNLLAAGEFERALEYVKPVLDQVNSNSIGFLSLLRPRRSGIADQQYAFLLERAASNVLADANTASGLSSYIFTPTLYVTFSAEGNARWSQLEETLTPPNISEPLRTRFFQIAGSILLRPLPPPDQDFTSSGRTGKDLVIRRLLPLFDKHAPETANALRSQLFSRTGETTFGGDSPLITQGLQPEEDVADTLEKLQDRIDRAKTSNERDSIYADVAAKLAEKGDVAAQDLADKIAVSERRIQVRRYVDMVLVQIALKRKQALAAAHLAKTGQLSNMQRAWAYTQVSQLLARTDKIRSLSFLNEAWDEARRLDITDPDRARALMAVAMQFVNIDLVRAWETLAEAIKSANSAQEFTGENDQLHFPVSTKSGLKIITIGGADFGLASLFRALARIDLYRSLDVAKTLKNPAPRASATLAIAGTLLENPRNQTATLPVFQAH